MLAFSVIQFWRHMPFSLLKKVKCKQIFRKISQFSVFLIAFKVQHWNICILLSNRWGSKMLNCRSSGARLMSGWGEVCHLPPGKWYQALDIIVCSWLQNFTFLMRITVNSSQFLLCSTVTVPVNNSSWELPRNFTN